MAIAQAALLISACSEPQLRLEPRGAGTAPLQQGVARIALAPARAFVIERVEDLLAGPEADGKLGDFRLDNGKAVFIIDAVGSALGFADSGGNLVDAATAGGADSLKQMFGFLDDTFPRQPIYERVEALRRGAVAVVRASGRDSMNSELLIETEYALRPGELALEIATTVTNAGTQPVTAYEIGDAIQWGRSERFAPGFGWTLPRRAEVAAGFIAGLGDDVTYAYVVKSGALKSIHGSAWSDCEAQGAVDLPPGGRTTARRFMVAGGAGGAEAAAEIARLRGETPTRLWGRVREQGSGATVVDVRVMLEDAAGRPMAVVRSQTDGYALYAPPGDYRLRAEGRGRSGLHSEVSLQAEVTQVDLTLSQPGALAFEVTEGGAPSSARITVLGTGGKEAPRLGPSFASPGGNIAYSASGAGQLEVPPGNYQVVASRGPAYDIDVKDVEVMPGQTARARFELKRVIDLRRLLCVDLHQHAWPSPDSGVSLRDRAASNLGEGLEVMVATDHNVIADWQPALAQLGAAVTGGRPLQLVVGNEATLDGVGHWNAYPLTYRAGEPRGGALDVRRKSAREIVAGLRAEDGNAEKVVQVNHPRAGFIGYFDAIKLDVRAPELPPDFAAGIDAIEIFSTKDVSLAEAPLRDWFGLLARGLPYTGVGGSDSHAIYEQEVGYPRTCVGWDGKMGPAEALVHGIRKRRDAIVTNGPFVRVSVAGRGMGQVAPAPRGRFRLDVEVQAAPWVDVRRLEVFVSGVRRGKPIEVPPSKAVVRYKDGIDLKVAEDAWVVVLVRGDASLEPVVSRRENKAATPLAITNPIFLDRDGDGRYTPSKQLR